MVSTRCSVCKRKIRLDSYRCKCDDNKLFCAEHKYPFAHDCPVDIIKEQREKLTRTILKVAPKKRKEEI